MSVSVFYRIFDTFLLKSDPDPIFVRFKVVSFLIVSMITCPSLGNGCYQFINIGVKHEKFF